MKSAVVAVILLAVALAAAEPLPTAEAYDWQTTPVPRRWSVGTFDWDGEGASGGTAKVKVE